MESGRRQSYSDCSNFLFKQKQKKQSKHPNWEKQSVFSLKKMTLKEKLMIAEKGQSKAGAVAERIEVGDG